MNFDSQAAGLAPHGTQIREWFLKTQDRHTRMTASVAVFFALSLHLHLLLLSIPQVCAPEVRASIPHASAPGTGVAPWNVADPLQQVGRAWP